MEKTKRILSLILAALCASSAFIACGETAAEEKPADVTTAAAEETAAEEDKILPDLPEVTYDGAEFKVLRWYNGEGHVHTHFEFDVDGLNGELLNDAIYQRNQEGK